MKVISNDKLIKRNGKIGNITSLSSIAILGVGMFFSFKDTDGSYLPYTFGALIVGFLMFQVGNYYMGKWGKSPRPDENLSSALKGLDNTYTLYHYMTPISHLLVGPAGVICLVPLNQAGAINYDADKKHWKQTGGNFFMKIFGGEGLGRPENEVKYTVEDAAKFLTKNEIDISPLEPEPILVFTNSKATLSAEESPVPAVLGDKLKEFIRKRAKDKPLSLEKIKEIESKING
jgi:hypothetical protein